MTGTRPELPPLADLAAIDAEYEPFVPFSDWAGVTVDAAPWDALHTSLKQRVGDDETLWARARAAAKRAAAIDTGAIEGLYQTDEGFTISVALQTGYWQAAYEKREERVRELIEAQLTAYDEVLDLATGSAPFAETWIRGLHATLCRSQRVYWVQTEVGPQEQDLPLGMYKTNPNHVVQPNGTIHAYAPVLQTSPEMERLVVELRSGSFVSAHPILQAAYAHYALTAVHPFADGNGRVARALASVYLYRAASIPLLILMEHRSEYFGVLRRADVHDYVPLVTFVGARTVDAFQLTLQSLRNAERPQPVAEAQALEALYRTRGGYAHADVDAAGHRLLLAIQERAAEVSDEFSNERLQFVVRRRNHRFPDAPPGLRNPVGSKPELLDVVIEAREPAAGQLTLTFVYHVPLDAQPTDEIVVVCQHNGADLRIQCGQLSPALRTVAKLQVALYVDEVVGAALADIRSQGTGRLRQVGYRP
jgi:hypothetical protein